MTLSIYDRLFDDEPERPLTHGDEARIIAATEAVDAVQRVVDAMTDHKGGRYVVRFSRGGTAATDLHAKRIIVTSAPLFDPTLSKVDKVVVLTGLSTHEIGHTEVSLDTAAILKRSFKDDRLAHLVANVLDDIRLERLMSRRYPGIADAFGPTLAWVARQNPEHATHLPVAFARCHRLADRGNFFIRTTRYAEHWTWSDDDETVRERAWWAEWVERYGDATKSAQVVDAITEGITHLREVKPYVEPEPEPEPEPDGDEPGEPGPGDDGEPEESESDDDEDGGSYDDGEDGEGDEPEHKPTPSGGDDDDDDLPEGESPFDDEAGMPPIADEDDSESDTEEAGLSAGKDGDDEGGDDDDDAEPDAESTAPVTDGSDAEPEERGVHDTRTDATTPEAVEPEADEVEDLTPEDDEDLDTDVDEVNKPDAGGVDLDRAIDMERTVERYRTTNGFGAMRIKVDL